MFTDVGYAAATMDAIAERSGKSRAAVYQYFKSKAEIFIVLMSDVGRGLLQTLKGLGPLGPGQDGFENLRAWILDYFGTVREYADVFSSWANAEIDDQSLHRPALEWLEVFAERLGSALSASGTDVADTRSMALAVSAMVERCCFLIGSRDLPYDENEMADTIARSVQLTLFPDSVRLFRVGTEAPTPKAAAINDIGAMRALAHKTISTMTPPLKREVSVQGAATVNAILDGAAQVFARKGFAATSVDDVMVEVGLSHGALYQYWTDLREVLHTLAAESLTATWDIVENLESFTPTARSAPAIVASLDDLLTNFERRAAVIRVWASLERVDPMLDQMASDSVAALQATLGQLIDRSMLADIHDADRAAIALIALVSHAPYGSLVFANWASHSQLVHTLALLLCRGFLGITYP